MSNIESSTPNNEKFAVSAFTPWIKGTMDVDSHYLTVNLPNTVLFGLIPAGKRKDRTPISGITSLYTDRKYKLGKMIIGALIVLSTIGNIGNSPVGSIVLILLGALLFASGIVTTFPYERSGVTQTITFPFLNRITLNNLNNMFQKSYRLIKMTAMFVFIARKMLKPSLMVLTIITQSNI